MERIGLTLPGGGARAAYQVGVLRAIYDICHFEQSPFQVISGISAGGVNGMWLAAGAKSFGPCTEAMWDRWRELKVDDIYRTDALSLFSIGASWIKDLSMGSMVKKRKRNNTYLLDTSPFKKMLEESFPFPAVKANIKSGLIHGLSLSATDYRFGTAVTFFDGDKSIQPWEHTLACGVRSELTVDHVMATASIPIFFPPIRIGGYDYGDGGIGLKSPLSPAIRMGATRLMVIGVQNPRGPVGKESTEKDVAKNNHATLGDVAGALLNALFLNSMDADIDRLERINHTVSFLRPEQLTPDAVNLRQIPILVIRPSKDLSCVGVKEFERFPFTIRHMLKGLGVTPEKGWDLLSYLAFDEVYSDALLNLGYSDTMAVKEDVLAFFGMGKSLKKVSTPEVSSETGVHAG
jgi:NTE family protein